MYHWYDIELACKHPAKWNEFSPVPRLHDKKWCNICMTYQEIVEIAEHRTPEDEDEEEFEFE